MILKGVLNIFHIKLTSHVLIWDISSLLILFIIHPLSPIIVYFLPIFLMDLQAYAQGRCIYWKWCWSRMY